MSEDLKQPHAFKSVPSVSTSNTADANRHSKHCLCQECLCERINELETQLAELRQAYTSLMDTFNEAQFELAEKTREVEKLKALNRQDYARIHELVQDVARLEREIEQWKEKFAESEAGLYDLATKATLASAQLAEKTAALQQREEEIVRLSTRIESQGRAIDKLLDEVCACEHDGNAVTEPCEMHKQWAEEQVKAKDAAKCVNCGYPAFKREIVP